MDNHVIKVDFTLAESEIERLGLALENVKYYCGALYTLTGTPTKKTVSLFGDIESTNDVFGSMTSKFIRAYEKYYLELRNSFSQDILKNLDTFYENLVNSFKSIRDLDEEMAEQINISE